MDVLFRPPPQRQYRRTRTQGFCAVTIAIALTLPVAQTVHAVDIYYARAIGQEYLPEPEPPKAPSERGPPQAPSPNESTSPELPALGAREAETPAPAQPRSLWSRVLIGTLVVAAIAALGNRGGGGGSAGVTVGTGSAPPPDAGNTGPGDNSGGGNGGDGGGGGIGIDVGLGTAPSAEGNRGNNRGRKDDKKGDKDDD